MWIFSVFLFIVICNSTSSQDLTLECRFYTNTWGEYCCELTDIEVIEGGQNVILNGTHLDGMTNADVELVKIMNSSVPFIIHQIFATFPNMTELEYDGVGLMSINLPDTPSRLVDLILINNNISRIEDWTFVNQTQLRYLRLKNSNVQEIGEDAFFGLTNLTYLNFIDNRIRMIAPRTFHPLVNVGYLDLEGNNLTRIGELFSANINLFSLFLEHNEITAISPLFVSHLQSENLGLVNLLGNVCVDEAFYYLFMDESWNEMNEALATCFRNFNGTETETKRITLEFIGNLEISDESGNIIARI